MLPVEISILLSETLNHLRPEHAIERDEAVRIQVQDGE